MGRGMSGINVPATGINFTSAIIRRSALQQHPPLEKKLWSLFILSGGSALEAFLIQFLHFFPSFCLLSCKSH